MPVNIFTASSATSLVFASALLVTISTVVKSSNVARLPDHVTPQRYQLTLLPVLERDERLCGHVWIDIAVSQPTKSIVLHAVNLTFIRIVAIHRAIEEEEDELDESLKSVEELCFSGIHHNNSISRSGRNEESNMVSSFLLDPAKDLLTILLDEEMHPEDRYRVGILYTAQVNEHASRGFFRKLYTRNENDCCQRWIGATQLEATHARKVFPCMDEPSFKAPFQLTVGHPMSSKSISNMPLQAFKSMDSADNWAWSTFHTTPAMPTYLMAVVVTELDHLETSYQSIDGRNVSIRIWTHSHKFDRLDFAVSMVPKVIRAFEEYLNVPYSLPKLDMIAIPGFEATRAMENWGLVVHSEDNLLSNPGIGEEDLLEQTLVAITIVHELAHQWFGNLVTSGWWDDIWLNEGLATLFENLILNQVAPELDPDVVMILFFQQSLLNDKVAQSNALDHPVDLLPSIEDKFDGFAYVKGSAVFRMVRSFVGEETFRNALQRYFSKFQFGNALSTDLWVLLNQEARRNQRITGRMNILRIMKGWTHQPGYPLVQVDRKGGMIQLSQKPFVDPDFPMTGNSSLPGGWWIPISMTHSTDPQFGNDAKLPVTWLTPKKWTVEIPDPTTSPNGSWILVNLESSGYFRVNYDELNWQLLSDQLKANHSVIPTVTRSQLIDDAFIMGHAGIIKYDIVTRLISYLEEADEVPSIRKMVVGHINRVQSIMFQHFNDGVFDKFLQETVDKMSRYAGSAPESDPKVVRARRNPSSSRKDFHSCALGDELCVMEALKLFRVTMVGTASAQQSKMVTDHFEEVWCAALRHGGRPEWTFAWEASRKSTDVVDKRRTRMLRAMCCTVDPAQQKQLLSRVFHPNIGQRPKETSVILAGLTENRSARPMVLNFVLQNWAFLTKHFRSRSEVVANALISLAKHPHSIENVEKLKSFVEQHRNALGPELLDQILSAAQTKSSSSSSYTPSS